jgi:fructan beta-fructosidase
MNDPNGLVFHAGEYHLFYQYNPFGDKWGHMSWGHAVSRDLIHWQHLPIALAEERGVMIFSGSAVVDRKNSSGFGIRGEPPLVAIYTGHYTEKPLQNQHIAYSTDRGRTWTKYHGNPILDIGDKDFRDPKVFWHEPSRRWIMVVAWPVHRKVCLYASPNLKGWTHLSDFGPAGSTVGIWECPDLFPVAVEDRPREQRWVLVVNVGGGAPAGGSGTQYFVGWFDGTRFVPDALSSEPLWADYGRDFYAAVSWSDIPKADGRRLWLGWMSNWEYAQDVPTAPWRSAMTVPRELTLRATLDGFRLAQRPVRELMRLRTAHRSARDVTVSRANMLLSSPEIAGPLLEVAAEFNAKDAAQFGLEVRRGASERTRLSCDLAVGRLSLDRTCSGATRFHPAFAGVHVAPLRLTSGRARLHVLCDTSSVEVFANDGESVITDLIFPASESTGWAFFSDNLRARLRAVDIWRLGSAWKE